MPNLLHRELTEAIIGIYYDVFNELGYGFLERVYQNAMYAELKNEGFNVTAQQRIKVHYKGLLVGDYYADLLIDNYVILELKAAESLAEEHEVQLLNYLRATDVEVGLLLNFGKKPEFKRIVYTNDRKRLKTG
ncbi:GxxExxY protein [Spirosoma aerophilum]